MVRASLSCCRNWCFSLTPRGRSWLVGDSYVGPHKPQVFRRPHPCRGGAVGFSGSIARRLHLLITDSPRLQRPETPMSAGRHGQVNDADRPLGVREASHRQRRCASSASPPLVRLLAHAPLLQPSWRRHNRSGSGLSQVPRQPAKIFRPGGRRLLAEPLSLTKVVSSRTPHTGPGNLLVGSAAAPGVELRINWTLGAARPYSWIVAGRFLGRGDVFPRKAFP